MQYILLIVAFIFLSTNAMAAEKSLPEAVGLSSKKLGLIDQAIKADIDAGKLTGATVSVMKNGKLAYHKAFGTRGEDGAAGPLKTDDIFRIYSMTKPITSVAALMLFEQGKLKLDDPISKFIPVFSNPMVLKTEGLVPVNRPITIADLLRHTSGVVYGFFGDTPARTEYKKVDLYGIQQSNAEMVGKLATLPLEHQPGSAWEYSHSTDILGHIVEIISGRSLDAYLEEEILGPLGMKDTAFFVPTNKKDRVVEPKFKGLSNPLATPKLLSGGGGLMSTAEDYLKFCTMILSGGKYDGKRFLKAETINVMTQNQLGDIQPGNYNLLGKNYGFGYGFAVRTAEDASISGSKGDIWWGGYAGTYFWIDPAKEMITVFMMQQPNLRAAYRPRLRSWIYDAVMN